MPVGLAPLFTAKGTTIRGNSSATGNEKRGHVIPAKKPVTPSGIPRLVSCASELTDKKANRESWKWTGKTFIRNGEKYGHPRHLPPPPPCGYSGCRRSRSLEAEMFIASPSTERTSSSVVFSRSLARCPSPFPSIRRGGQLFRRRAQSRVRRPL